jgi:hypothetical protein
MSASASPGRTTKPAVPSPLDPFLVAFLARIAREEHGIGPNTELAAVATELGWEPAFAHGLLTSARRRGYIVAHYPRGARGSNRWRITSAGAAFVASRSEPDTTLAPVER